MAQGELTVCYYCGNFADSTDHVVPRHLLKRAGAMGMELGAVMRIRLWEVPACRECNTLIGGAIFKTLPDRCKYVKAKLRARYRRILAMPRWTPEELGELGPELRRYVQTSQRAREAIQARVSWRPAKSAVNLSAVFELFRNTVHADASKSPTGADE